MEYKVVTPSSEEQQTTKSPIKAKTIALKQWINAKKIAVNPHVTDVWLDHVAKGKLFELRKNI